MWTMALKSQTTSSHPTLINRTKESGKRLNGMFVNFGGERGSTENIGLFRDFRVKKNVDWEREEGGSIFLLQKSVIFSSAGFL
jgi:hypothetical protein